MKIVKMLNELYTIFDELTDSKSNSNIYKVETVGDKYMAVSGLPDECENHAKCIARLALDMLDMAKNVMMGTEAMVSASELCSLFYGCSVRGQETKDTPLTPPLIPILNSPVVWV